MAAAGHVPGIRSTRIDSTFGVGGSRKRSVTSATVAPATMSGESAALAVSARLVAAAGGGPICTNAFAERV